MAAWLILLVAALIALVIGSGSATTWLIIIALVLLPLGLIDLARRGSQT